MFMARSKIWLSLVDVLVASEGVHLTIHVADCTILSSLCEDAGVPLPLHKKGETVMISEIGFYRLVISRDADDLLEWAVVHAFPQIRANGTSTLSFRDRYGVLQPARSVLQPVRRQDL